MSAYIFPIITRAWASVDSVLMAFYINVQGAELYGEETRTKTAHVDTKAGNAMRSWHKKNRSAGKVLRKYQ